MGKLISGALSITSGTSSDTETVSWLTERVRLDGTRIKMGLGELPWHSNTQQRRLLQGFETLQLRVHAEEDAFMHQLREHIDQYAITTSWH